MMRVPYAIALLMIAVAPAMAQDPSELLSARPEKSEPPDVVEHGVLQLETAAYVQRASSDYQCTIERTNRPARSELLNGAWLLRLGIGDGVELRVEGSASSEAVSVDSCASSERIDARVRELSVPAIGLKMSLMKEAAILPSLSIAASVSLQDQGASLVSSLAPALRLTASRSLGEDLALIANVATSWDGTSIVPAAAYTISLTGALNESIGLYAGLIGDLALGAGTAHSVDAGIGYAFSDAVSAEIFGAVGIMPAAPDYYAGIGLAVAP